MLAIRKYKLFVLGLLSVLMFAKARSTSISQIGDVRIEVSDAKWLCDKIVCPRGTHRCYVSKHKEADDPTTLVRTNICYAKHNHVLSKSVTTETVDRDTNIKMHLNSYRSGIISSFNSYSSSKNGFDEKKFNQELNNDLRNMHEDLDREMKNMNRNLNNEMRHLNNNLSKMTHNLMHMFD